MALPQPKPLGHTLADWAAWEGRWELIQGIAYDMTPAPSLEHQRISMNLSATLFQALDEAKRRSGGGECEVFAAPIDVFLGEDVFQPDLVIVCAPAKKTPRGIEGCPDLVVEILSPSTASRDTVRKRWAYEAAGVPEYLIVDPQERVAELLRLEDARYISAARVEWGAVVSLLGDAISVAVG